VVSGGVVRGFQGLVWWMRPTVGAGAGPHQGRWSPGPRISALLEGHGIASVGRYGR
jgi:hypothetical protein